MKKFSFLFVLFIIACGGNLPPIPWPIPTTTTSTTTLIPVTTTTTTTLAPIPIPTPTPIPNNCNIPGPDDTGWRLTGSSTSMYAALLKVEQEIGSQCGQDPNATLAKLAAALRAKNICARGPWDDEIVIQDEQGNYQGYHSVAFGNGCYTQNQPRDTWKFVNIIEPPPSLCPVLVGDGYFIDLVVTSIGGSVRDFTATAKYCGFPVRNDIFKNCGTKCCVLGVDGLTDVAIECERVLSGTPSWIGKGIEFNSPLNGNPYNVRYNSGKGTLRACGFSSCSNEIFF